MDNPTTLYKKDSKGNIRFWQISTEGADIVQRSGIVGTDSPVENRKTAKAKNVGRSNETTPEEQALSEMESSITKKLRKAYFQTQQEAEEEEVILPMKAKSYDDHVDKVKWGDITQPPVYVQPKLDGMRALAICKDGDIKFMSRQGVEITTMDHLKHALMGLKNVVLDGELYAHGYTFQENMKMCKKYRKGETEKVRFHVYDMVSKGDYSYRYTMISKIVDRISEPHIELVETFKVNSEQEMKEFHAQFLGYGFEGSMIRHTGEGYGVNKRSSSLLKVKDFEDIALPVLDVIPNDQRPEHGSFVFEWEGARGHPLGDDILGCGMKFSHEEREEILQNKQDYIGKTAELRFFEYSDTGVPRFPVCVGLRQDK